MYFKHLFTHTHACTHTNIYNKGIIEDNYGNKLRIMGKNFGKFWKE